MRSVARTVPKVEGPPAEVPPAWREYYLKLLGKPRFAAARNFLRGDITNTLKRVIPHDASVLEVGVGGGEVLAGLPNAVRHGIDILPEAVEIARGRDSAMKITRADAASFAGDTPYDAIICDRLVHSIPDVQRLLENLARNLAPEGRIFLTCFNFLWSVPLAAGQALGLHEKSPPENSFSANDFENLFALSGLEKVSYEDRLIVPAGLAGLGTWVNKVGAKLPPFDRLACYRIYTLRKSRVRREKAKVTVVVPARNEAGNIEAAVKRIPVMGKGTEVIFVEGGSSDDTWSRIQQTMGSYKGPLELKLFRQTGKGKGDAVRVGFDKATGDLLMILDADLTVSPEDLPKFYEVMISGLTDYAQGTRLVYPMDDRAMRFLNKLGNRVFAQIFSFMLDQPITDTLCGTKVLWKHDWAKIVANRKYFGDFDPFGDFDLIFGARKANLKLVELPVRYKDRVYGETNISRFRHGLMLFQMCAFAARKIKFV